VHFRKLEERIHYCEARAEEEEEEEEELFLNTWWKFFRRMWRWSLGGFWALSWFFI